MLAIFAVIGLCSMVVAKELSIHLSAIPNFPSPVFFHFSDVKLTSLVFIALLLSFGLADLVLEVLAKGVVYLYTSEELHLILSVWLVILVEDAARLIFVLTFRATQNWLFNDSKLVFNYPLHPKHMVKSRFDFHLHSLI